MLMPWTEWTSMPLSVQFRTSCLAEFTFGSRFHPVVRRQPQVYTQWSLEAAS